MAQDPNGIAWDDQPQPQQTPASFSTGIASPAPAPANRPAGATAAAPAAPDQDSIIWDGQPAPTQGTLPAAATPKNANVERWHAYLRGERDTELEAELRKSGLAAPEPPPGENIFTGVAKGVGQGASESVYNVAAFLHNHLGVPMPDELRRVDESGALKAENPSEAVGKMGESIAEFALGDEALKGVGIAQRLKLAQQIAELAKSSPRIAKAIGIGLASMRAGTVGGVQSLVHGSNLRNAIESGATTALTAGAFEGANALAAARSTLVRMTGKASQAGLGATLLYRGLSDALEPQRPGESQSEYEARRVGGSIQALLSGHGIASTFGNVPRPPASVEEMEAQAKALEEKKAGLVGQITKATGEERPAAGRGLAAIDTTGVDTYTGLRDKLNAAVVQNVATVENALKQKGPLPLSVYTRVDNVPGGAPIISNPVSEALDHLSDFYTKTNRPAEAGRIMGIQNKAAAQGLSPYEVNEIAQEHGRVLTSYNQNNQLASGLAKQAAEGTRSALKDVVHKIAPETQALDNQTSDLIKTRGLAQDAVEEAERFENNIKKAGMLAKVGRAIGATADVATGGIGKAIFRKFTGMGDESMSIADREDMLEKSLKQLRKLNAMTPQQAVQSLSGAAAPAAKAATQSGASAASGAPAGTKEVEVPYEVPSEKALDFQQTDILGDEPDEKTRGHEHGHALVGHILGIEPHEIRTPEHPVNQLKIAQGRRVHATTSFNLPDDWFEGDKFISTPENLAKILTMTMGGLASDEIHQGVERDLNPAGFGDEKYARKLMDDAKTPINKREALLDKAYGIAKKLLNTPDARDIIMENRDVREPGLDRGLHVSNKRLQEIYGEYDRRINETNTGRTAK